MPAWTVIPALVAAGFVPGWLIVRQFGRGRWSLPLAFAGLALGLAALGWAALLLAEVGLFSIGWLALVWALLVGGLITTLADSSFAFACNSYNELTVASGFTVDLMAPGRLGDVLTATCTEVSKAGRTGVYDVTVTNQRGERIAVFRGRSYTARGKPVVPPAA